MNRRTGYFFQINAGGTRVDGLISLWTVSTRLGMYLDARTARTGWLVADRFHHALEPPGLNVLGTKPGALSKDQRSSPDPDLFRDLSRAGRLTGVEKEAGQRDYPYAVGKTKQFTDHRDRGRGSRWRSQRKITPQLVTVFTANTDFAETG
jgi:hypothetical protein